VPERCLNDRQNCPSEPRGKAGNLPGDTQVKRTKQCADPKQSPFRLSCYADAAKECLAKVGDFGMSRRIGGTGRQLSRDMSRLAQQLRDLNIGTPAYCAPEVSTGPLLNPTTRRRSAQEPPASN
jgi:serine/threonine protein kinase